MSFNEQLEQLAFGKSLPDMTYCLGIYLSANLVYVAEVRLDATKPKVEHLVRVPLPAPASTATKVTGVLNTDILADTERLSALLKQAMGSAGKWRSEFAIVTLAHSFGILRYFVMPAIDPKFWRMAVPAEAKKYIPVQFDDLVVDFQVEPLPPGPDKRPRQGVLFGVTQGKNLLHVKALLAALGVKLAGVELSPCSVGRLWEALEPTGDAPYAQVHFDQGDVHILLAERGLPVFVREIVMGPEAKVADRRKLDLAGCMDFAKKQLGVPRPSKVRLSGTNSEMAGWQEALAQEAGTKVELQDTAKLIGVKAAEWGGFAAVGAGLRHLAPARLTMDLSGSGRVDESDRRTAQSLFTVAGALSLFFLGVGMFRHGQAHLKQQELNMLRARGGNVEAFSGKSSAQIEAMVKDLQKRSQSMASITAASAKAADIMEQVAEIIPESAWVHGMAYSFSLDAATRSSGQRTLQLQGSVIGQSEATEQDTAIQFKEGLQKDERFKKTFTSVEVSIQAAKGVAVSADPGSGQAAVRTSFSMSCVGRIGG